MCKNTPPPYIYVYIYKYIKYKATTVSSEGTVVVSVLEQTVSWYLSRESAKADIHTDKHIKRLKLEGSECEGRERFKPDFLLFFSLSI